MDKMVVFHHRPRNHLFSFSSPSTRIPIFSAKAMAAKFSEFVSAEILCKSNSVKPNSMTAREAF